MSHLATLDSSQTKLRLSSTDFAGTKGSIGLMGWLALAALLHRYRGSGETRLDEDLKACREADPIGVLLKNLRQRRPALVAHPGDFAGAMVDRCGLLALYIACMYRGILDFYTGAKVVTVHPGGIKWGQGWLAR